MISGLTQSEPERDPQAELEFHVDARHFGDDVRVGVAHAVVHLAPSMTSLVHVATGSAKALGAPATAKTPTALATNKNRPVRDRIARYFASSQ
jgi:hypothetical protein